MSYEQSPILTKPSQGGSFSAHNPKVVGSNPARATRTNSRGWLGLPAPRFAFCGHGCGQTRWTPVASHTDRGLRCGGVVVLPEPKGDGDAEGSKARCVPRQVAHPLDRRRRGAAVGRVRVVQRSRAPAAQSARWKPRRSSAASATGRPLRKASATFAITGSRSGRRASGARRTTRASSASIAASVGRGLRAYAQSAEDRLGVNGNGCRCERNRHHSAIEVDVYCGPGSR
jgi:hypothetical protein